MSEKPLSVRVAEALGCVPRLDLNGGDWKCDCAGYAHSIDWIDSDCLVNSYATDWSAAGPLVEKYKIQVGPSYLGIGPPAPWCAATGHDDDRDGDEWAFGPTPLIAVCELVLKLKEAGKI